MILHTKEQVKELSNRQDYIDKLSDICNSYGAIANLYLEVRRNQMIIDAELSKYMHLIGTKVSYEGIFADKAKTGTITAILHFYHSGIIVRVDYDTNGFDNLALEDLKFI